MSKVERLQCWMRDKRIFATHEVMQWGLENYYVRANRTRADFCRLGWVRTLSAMEKVLFGYTTKEGVYAWVGRSECASPDRVLAGTEPVRTTGGDGGRGGDPALSGVCVALGGA